MSEARIIYDRPASEYYADPAIGGTALRDALRSPLHFWARHLDPAREFKETPAMRLGTLAHLAILEPERWASETIIAPSVDRRTKAGKEAWAEFVEKAAGKEIVSAEDAALVESIAAAVRGHRGASALLKGAATEVSLYWRDGATGVLCKGRMDAIAQHDVIVDLKTCQDASPAAFTRSIANFGYHIQAAHYLDGYEAATGVRPRAYIWIAVESSAPHGVAVYAADAAMLEIGAEKRAMALEIIAECTESGHWPGYPAEIQTISLPGWAAF